MNFYLFYITVFIFGMCIGSFANVCIYRLPLSKSIVTPRSSCVNCGNMIRFYDNIPIISYLILKGHCRYCKVKISFRYPMVEVISGLFALCVVLKFGLSIKALIYFSFIISLIIITYIDIDYQIIPDEISLSGIPIGFIASFGIPDISYLDSIFGILLGGGSLYLVGLIYSLIRGEEGMGGGDVKLLAMIGAFIGWKGVIFTVFTASAAGSLVGIPLMFIKSQNMKLKIPFGPFLAVGAITYLFWGQQIIYLYFQFIRAPYGSTLSF
ncbi:MAG: prepilin peptidase [Desulfobacterales bacterium]|nr:prepilin peptidase [Desulfobacterales bacterium]